jgi:ABC-type Co2+ transport system permease subunit
MCYVTMRILRAGALTYTLTLTVVLCAALALLAVKAYMALTATVITPSTNMPFTKYAVYVLYCAVKCREEQVACPTVTGAAVQVVVV